MGNPPIDGVEIQGLRAEAPDHIALTDTEGRIGNGPAFLLPPGKKSCWNRD